jgi:hypothetical protein
MKTFNSAEMFRFRVEYNLDDLSFECELDRPTETVAPELQHLFPAERSDFITLKSQYDGDFLQIFFLDDAIIKTISSRFRMTIQNLALPQAPDPGGQSFSFEEVFPSRFLFRGHPGQKIVEIVLDDSMSKINYFRYARNLIVGMYEGAVKRLLFSDVAFVGRNQKLLGT